MTSPDASPLAKLHAAIDAWRRDEALARDAFYGGDADAQDAQVAPRPKLNAHRVLASPQAREWLADAQSIGAISSAHAGAIVAHMARYAAERELGAARERLASLAQDAVTAGAQTVKLVDYFAALFQGQSTNKDARAAVDAHLDATFAFVRGVRRDADLAAASVMQDAPARPDVGIARDEFDVLVQRALDLNAPHALAGLQQHARDTSLHTFVAHASQTLVAAPSVRAQRLGQSLALIQLRDALSERTRLRVSTRALLPRARFYPRPQPRTAAIAMDSVNAGVISELALVDAAGRALAHTLCHAAHPSPFAWPLDGTLGRALGTVLALRHTHPDFVRRTYGASPREAESLARLFSAVLALDVRITLSAPAVRAHALAQTDPARAAAERLAKLLDTSTEIPNWLGASIALTPAALLARARGRLSGLALHHMLIEQCDQDWYRNPRTEEILRALCEPGGTMSIEAWLTEQGGSLEHAIATLNSGPFSILA